MCACVRERERVRRECACMCVRERVGGCQWVQATQCRLPVCAQVRGFFKSQWLWYGATSLTFCHGPNWSPCDPPGTFNAARAKLSSNGMRRAMNDELVCEILRRVVVQIKVVSTFCHFASASATAPSFQHTFPSVRRVLAASSATSRSCMLQKSSSG
jgi:hypothetical protein